MGARRRQASGDSWKRTKKGPLYYSAMDVPRGGLAQDRPDKIKIPHTPPDFAKTRIGVPLLKPGEEVHYATGIDKSSKVYNVYVPPATATKTKPPWAARDCAEVSDTDVRGYATMDLSQRISSRRGGGSALGHSTVPRGYEGGITGRSGMSRRSRSSLLNC